MTAIWPVPTSPTPPTPPTAPQRVRSRRILGAGIAAATLPYLVLKCLWLAGGNAGMADPTVLRTRTYLVANVVTVVLDALVIVVAVGLTSRRGRNLPGWLVLGAMWPATGLLLPLIGLVPIGAAVAVTGQRLSPVGDALRPWVYVVVYASFAVQGVLLLWAFGLYCVDRWPTAANRFAVGVRLRRLRRFTAAASAAVGVVYVAISAHGLESLNPFDRATNAFYGVVTLAGAGALLPAAPRRTDMRRWLALATVWAGSGCMVWWGLYFLAYSQADPSLTSLPLNTAAVAKVLTGLAVAITYAALFRSDASRSLRGRPRRPDGNVRNEHLSLPSVPLGLPMTETTAEPVRWQRVIGSLGGMSSGA